MNRLEKILALEKEEVPFIAGRYTEVVNGLVMCLTPEEALAALDMTFEGLPSLRRMVARKIRTDMQSSLRDEHLILIDQLQASIPKLRPPERGKCLTVLLDLVSALTTETALNRLLPLLTYEYKPVRTRILTWFRKNANTPYSEAVKVAWEKYHDFESARLVAEYAPLEVVAAVFDKLEEDCRGEGWLLSRLYLRFGGKAPACLERLKIVDAITYLYVCAKLGVRVPDDELITIHQEHQADERSGLIIWCAGRMGAWDVLMQIAEIEREQWHQLSWEPQALT